ncbi:MAG: BofC C-terminal domain-containing protein, partial [Coriobacteriaceae bacterium]|nr:BofC C-terminal domain-containing protein [Coriobacteriaceae bacterium]
PGYMAPEQAKGSTVDNRTDLFAIGTIAYEMLTGKNPFGAGDGTDATTLLYRIVHEPAPDLPEVASEGLPEDIRPGVLAALNKDPDDRPQDAASFKAMLHGAAAPAPGMKPASKPASTLAQQASSSANKKWLPYALVGGIGVVVLIAVFAFATSGGGGGGGMVGSPTLMQQNAEDENSDFYLTIEDGKVVVYRGSLGDAASELEAITDIEASKLKPETISILEKGVPVTDTNTVEALLEAYSEEANRGLSIDMSVIDARIAASTGRHNVAVGVIDLSSGKTFLTDNANTQFEASGFYLPIVNTAVASGIGVSDDIPAVLYNQDNAAANSLINRIGGFAELNARLSSSGLRNTSYNRFFGDTSSSAENLTTAADAVESLRIIYDSGAYTSMPNELGSIGVVSPPGTVYAHRGIGIKTSVNTFAIVSTSKASYAVVVLTTGMGGSSDAAKAAATPLISDILSIVSSQVESSVG